jgi:uroporphyrinogen decarboxylase
MNSRERVLTTLNHRQPDRIAVDLGSHGSSGISAIAYARLRKFLELKDKPVRVFDPVQQLAMVDEDVLERFGVDTIDLGRAFAPSDAWADWVLPDGTPCQMPYWALPERGKAEWVIRSRNGMVIARMPDGVLYFEQCYFPFVEEGGPRTIAEAMDNCSWTALTTPPGPLIEGPNGLKVFAEGARRLRRNADRAIVWSFGGNLFEIGQFFYRMDKFLALLAGEPRKAHEFLDKLLEFHLANLEHLLGAVGEYIDVIVFSDDLGMQTGLLLSPKMYREFFKPRHALMWSRAKELANVKVMLHSDGAIRELLPDLIEIGLDAVNPVQTTLRGMDARELKAQFGKDLVFWGGGCDGQTVLFRGVPEEIQTHVKAQVSIFGPGGGFVFQQVDNIMANIGPESIVTMYEALGCRR